MSIIKLLVELYGWRNEIDQDFENSGIYLFHRIFSKHSNISHIPFSGQININTHLVSKKG